MNLPSIFCSIFLILATAGSIKAQSSSTAEVPRYIKVPAGYLMVLRQGDQLFEQLEKFALAEHIPSANFMGMGFVNVRFGYYDFSKKKFSPKDYDDVELASMQGTIAWKGDQPSVHCHGVVAGADFLAHGGHILSATVGTGSLEILITVHDKKLERRKEETIGADVLRLD